MSSRILLLQLPVLKAFFPDLNDHEEEREEGPCSNKWLTGSVMVYACLSVAFSPTCLVCPSVSGPQIYLHPPHLLFSTYYIRRFRFLKASRSPA